MWRRGLRWWCCWQFCRAACAAQSSDQALLAGLTADFARLAPQTIRPASGYIRYPYLIPAGYYTQMWDWDGFFIGAHWANQSTDDAKLLHDWVLNFANSADATGYVSGCITPAGPRPIFGKFAMKPFLAQGAVIAAEQLHDYEWIRPVFPAMVKIAEYRRKTQYDDRWGLWFWSNSMQSGADNNPALSNEPKDESAILAVDASVWAMREYRAMALIARKLGYSDLADKYKEMASDTRKAILKNLWVKDEAIFLNRWRDNGKFIHVVSWSSFVPLADGMLSQKDAERMIRQHLLNPAEMRSAYGFRSLAKSDPHYNNEAIINPYSNWQGPLWINANFIDWIALRRYGFTAESKQLAETLATMLRQDIAKWGRDARGLRRGNRRGPCTHSGRVAPGKVRRLRGLESACPGHAAVRGHRRALHDAGDSREVASRQVGKSTSQLHQHWCRFHIVIS